MAKIHEEVVLIKLSKLVRSEDGTTIALPEGFTEALEAFVADLLDDSSVIVEAVVDDGN